MANRVPIEIDEWYHCYNRGVDKRRIFQTPRDYEKFLISVYLALGSKPLRRSNVKCNFLHEVLERVDIGGERLVDIGAYVLMPNHFHMLLKEREEGSIALYMQRILTSYTMYFNKKNDRSGALLAGTFKSKHVSDDDYLKHVVSYIHLNPVELYAPEWKRGKGDTRAVEDYLNTYRYSSLHAFKDEKHPTRKILSDAIFDLYDTIPTPLEMLEDAKGYYETSPIE